MRKLKVAFMFLQGVIGVSLLGLYLFSSPQDVLFITSALYLTACSIYFFSLPSPSMRWGRASEILEKK